MYGNLIMHMFIRLMDSYKQKDRQREIQCVHYQYTHV